MHLERKTLQTNSWPDGIYTKPLLNVSSELILNSVCF